MKLKKRNISNYEFQKLFLDTKKMEGFSERTLNYYEKITGHLL